MHVPNFSASSLSTGTCEIAWQRMASGPRSLIVADAVSRLNKATSGASTPSKEGAASPRPLRSKLSTKPRLSTCHDPPRRVAPSCSMTASCEWSGSSGRTYFASGVAEAGVPPPHPGFSYGPAPSKPSKLASGCCRYPSMWSNDRFSNAITMTWSIVAATRLSPPAIS